MNSFILSNVYVGIMKEIETSESVMSKLDGDSGEIELTETSVRLILYKSKLFGGGLKKSWDKSKIKEVKEIPLDKMTKVLTSKLPGGGGAINIHFPGAGLLGYIPIFFSKEQTLEAEKMTEMLIEVSTQTTPKRSKDTAKIIERRGISPSEVLFTAEALKRSKDTTKIIERRGISPSEVLFTAEGTNGQIVLTNKGVLIGREGLWKKMVSGAYAKGDKFLPYKSISGVQFKEPGITWGYIQFTLPGGIENRGGTWDAGSDENTVTFNANKLDVFRKIRDVVEDRTLNPTVPAFQTISQSSIADELTKLAALKRDGAITEEEYEQLKRDLIGRKSK